MKNNKFKGWLFFLVSIAIVIMLFYFTQGGNNGLKVDLLGSNASGTTIEQLIGDGKTKESEIKYICISDGGIGYALK